MSISSRSAPGNRRGASEPEEEELEITSMIDLTFLLLIFFMVSSSMSPAQRLELPASTAGQTEEVNQQIVLVLDFYGEDTNHNGLLDPGEDSNGNGKFDRGFDREQAKTLGGAQPVTLGNVRLYLLKPTSADIKPNELEVRLFELFEKSKDSSFILQASRKMPASVVREVLKIAKRAGAEKSTVAVSVSK